MRRMTFVVAFLLTPVLGSPEMPPEENIKLFAESWLAKKPAKGFGVTMSMSEAAVVQTRYTALIAKDLGDVVGYKAGLTNPAVQKRFNYDKPIRGTLFAKMILSGPARVPAAFGSRPVYEADMVAVVGDAARAMSARSPLEALQALKEIRPFIELPDLVFDPQVKLDGPSLLAVNVGARLGVLGDSFSLPATAESVEKLAAVKIEVIDQNGAMVGGGKGADVLNNPLNAVLWIAESLKAEGKVLRNGDLLSLGSFSALLPPKAGSTITVRYIGLVPVPAEITVTFE
jgi:2-keto-4-pentenoate hydratase